MILFPENQGYAYQEEMLETIAHILGIDTDEVADAAPAPKQLEDGGQATIDNLIEINLGTDEGPRPT